MMERDGGVILQTASTNGVMDIRFMRITTPPKRA